MTVRLRFPTLSSSHAAAARLHAPLVGLALGLGALTGCESPSPHALLDAEAEPSRRAEPSARPGADPVVPQAHDSVTPASGALRLPSVLQGYGV